MLILSLHLCDLPLLLADDKRRALADAFEVRLDTANISDLSSLKNLLSCGKKVIATCRSRTQNGGFAGREADRLNLLVKALAVGAEYVDIDWKDAFLASIPGEKRILSFHDFASIPENLDDIFQALKTIPAFMYKIAVTARTASENFNVFRLLENNRKNHGPKLAAFCMGEFGTASRIAGKKFASAATYAALGQNATAPGQIDILDMATTHRHNTINESTTLFAILGQNVEYSLSPAVHNAVFEKQNRDACYLPIKISGDDWDSFFKSEFSFSGFSVTAPLKEKAFAEAREKDPACQNVGAANTMTKTADGWKVWNTDYLAALSLLRDKLPSPAGKTMAIAGSGGLARAFLATARDLEMHCEIFCRKPEMAKIVLSPLWKNAKTELSFHEIGQSLKSRANVLANATPVWDIDFFNGESFGENSIALEGLYHPRETALTLTAKRKKCPIISGLDLFCRQAFFQAKLWAEDDLLENDIRESALKRLTGS